MKMRSLFLLFLFIIFIFIIFIYFYYYYYYYYRPCARGGAHISKQSTLLFV